MFNSIYNEPRKSKREMLGSVRLEYGESIGDSKLIARNTVRYAVRMPDGSSRVRIRLHNTDVCEFAYKPGADSPHAVKLNSGGFKTRTTRDRLDSALNKHGIRIHTDRGVWTVNTAAGSFSFVDGEAFKLPSGKPCRPAAVRLEKESARHKRFDNLIKAYIAAMRKNGIPTDSLGDPIIFDWNPHAIGEHVLLDWLKSKYVFLKLAFYACTFSGLSETGAAIFIQDYNRERNTRGRGSMARLLESKVRRYFRRGLGFQV